MKNFPYIRLVGFVDANVATKTATTMANTNATNNATLGDSAAATTTTVDDGDGDGDDDYVDDDNFLHGLAATTTATFDKN